MNAVNRIPISVRITQDDADFIANLQIDGANTPSEKIRELLKQARQSYTQSQDYGTALGRAEQFLQNAKRDLLHAEKELGVHSHILARLFELLPDLTATLATDFPSEVDLEGLKKYEREVMWRIVRLMDSVLQLAITGKGAAFDDGVLEELENTLNLAQIIRQHDEK
ncbi:hypothetical protein [Aggregatibacter kilianii]|uniref:hypothetical protein n=1 Tax=Aggregatibacter kilianii TaxID=2025884 RepID=UPI000D65E195|nr:hypothetical protein [Aggregatibacter kilianii]